MDMKQKREIRDKIILNKKLDKKQLDKSEKLKRLLPTNQKLLNSKKCTKCGKRKKFHHYLCDSCWNKKYKGGEKWQIIK